MELGLALGRELGFALGMELGEPLGSDLVSRLQRENLVKGRGLRLGRDLEQNSEQNLVIDWT